MVGTTKYTDEQISFILERTVRPIPRGETNNVHLQVVDDFKKKYGKPTFGLNQVRYVTERYGSDPAYGNRWAALVRSQQNMSDPMSQDQEAAPISPIIPTATAKRVAQRSTKGKFALCTACNGTGVKAVHRPAVPQRSTAQQRQGQEQDYMGHLAHPPHAPRVNSPRSASNYVGPMSQSPNPDQRQVQQQSVYTEIPQNSSHIRLQVASPRQHIPHHHQTPIFRTALRGGDNTYGAQHPAAYNHQGVQLAESNESDGSIHHVAYNPQRVQLVKSNEDDNNFQHITTSAQEAPMFPEALRTRAGPAPTPWMGYSSGLSPSPSHSLTPYQSYPQTALPNLPELDSRPVSRPSTYSALGKRGRSTPSVGPPPPLAPPPSPAAPMAHTASSHSPNTNTNPNHNYSPQYWHPHNTILNNRHPSTTTNSPAPDHQPAPKRAKTSNTNTTEAPLLSDS
ncbi:Uu.00g028360.m01.CDS01 [Anthostomella pinea]|uniref:Uu.00g028360.m01.CDS01 n=1 Tax=Anthostomella pinea TaxID=933095 RepID=A0AAI8YCX4_9PEZI|nr:Uu.00g028360.m01.CDS01 [Anthostomella pinea]